MSENIEESPSPSARSRSDLSVRLVQDAGLTNAQVYEIWKKVESSPWALEDGCRNPFAFTELLALPTTYAFVLGDDPSGLVWFTGVTPGGAAYANIALWHYRAFARYDILKKVVAAVFLQAGLHRMTALVAQENSKCQRMMGLMDFSIEGHPREALCYDGRWVDAVLYGILAAEVRNWNEISRQDEEPQAEATDKSSP